MTAPTRLLAISALSYPVLTIATFAVFPKPPGGDVSPAHDPAWLAAHTGAVIAQSYLRSIAALGFLLLAIALATWARPAAARVLVAGGAGCSLLLLLSQASVLGAALGVRDGVSQASTRSADSLSAAALDLSSLPAVLLFAGAAVTLWRAKSSPRWLTALTALGVPLALFDALSYDGGPFAFLGIIGLAYFLLWSLLCSVTLARRPMPTDQIPDDRIIERPRRDYTVETSSEALRTS